MNPEFLASLPFLPSPPNAIELFSNLARCSRPQIAHRTRDSACPYGTAPFGMQPESVYFGGCLGGCLYLNSVQDDSEQCSCHRGCKYMYWQGLYRHKQHYAALCIMAVKGLRISRSSSNLSGRARKSRALSSLPQQKKRQNRKSDDCDKNAHESNHAGPPFRLLLG